LFAIVFNSVVNGDYVRMTQTGTNNCFASKSFSDNSVANQLWFQYFDGNLSVQKRVKTQPNLGHSAACYLSVEPVSAAQKAPWIIDWLFLFKAHL
jgi:hypothetical protein